MRASKGSGKEHLIERDQYVLSYDRDRGIPTWVAWHVEQSDLGDSERSQFAPDSTLPEGWYRVTPNDYRNSGYDRGHLCPSADRTRSSKDNSVTFLMTNIVPQAPDNNQGPWADLENYCRDLVRDGMELYIVAGVAGPFSNIADGKVAVPGSLWKVIVVLPSGDDDVNRVTESTRVIAVVLPNENGIRDRDWKSFRTSVTRVEKLSGIDLLNAIPDEVEQSISEKTDSM